VGGTGRRCRTGGGSLRGGGGSGRAGRGGGPRSHAGGDGCRAARGGGSLERTPLALVPARRRWRRARRRATPRGCRCGGGGPRRRGRRPGRRRTRGRAAVVAAAADQADGRHGGGRRRCRRRSGRRAGGAPRLSAASAVSEGCSFGAHASSVLTKNTTTLFRLRAVLCCGAFRCAVPRQ